jgi:L-cysteine desulfidase
LAFLVEAAVINRQAADAALADPRLELGRALQAQAVADLPAPFAAIHHAQTPVSAASEARMAGAAVPIMAVAGSGNQGINNFLGVLAVAEVLGSPLAALARALAISSAVVVLVKGYAAQMTAFCGGAIAASCGVAGGGLRRSDDGPLGRVEQRGDAGDGRLHAPHHPADTGG